jgi:hypothetical protein
MGCTRVIERVAVSLGQAAGPAPSRFAPAVDVAQGGVLWALPALLSNGLLRGVGEHFKMREGFYGVVHVFVLLAFMALCRIKTVERLRFNSPGELGLLLGLDRIPEVRTLRLKIKELVQSDLHSWGAQLSQEWMKDPDGAAGILYVDGRVSVYHGRQTPLPKRYVSRERLCLRGLTDYWVNDQTGRPFFSISTPFNDGLLAALREDIIPRLLTDVPNQPDEKALAENRYAHRFVIIFDREGYSPEYFKELWDQRIACQTYRKNVQDAWREEEFAWRETPGPHGETVRLRLAERGARLSNGLWMREIRRLGDNGHQTAVLSSDYVSSEVRIGFHMFSRWSQENFFKYMGEHFDLSGLASYSTEAVDETRTVVNPAWRALDSQVKSKASQLTRRRAAFSQVCLSEELNDVETERFARRKAELKDAVESLEKELAELKENKKKTERKIELRQLSEEERFRVIAPNHRFFLDTIKMIAYRAETAMALIARQFLARKDDMRPLLREIYAAPADLIPNESDQTLTVALHPLANALSNEAARHLAEQLTETDTTYPGTDLRLCFKLVSDPNPRDQEF